MPLKWVAAIIVLRLRNGLSQHFTFHNGFNEARGYHHDDVMIT